MFLISNFLHFETVNYNNPDFLNSILSNFDKNNPTRDNEWNCFVETSHQSKNKPTIPEDLFNILNKKIKDFCLSFSHEFFNTVFINDIWYNVYTKNMYQEKHSHVNSLFSGIYFLKFNQYIHSAPVFYNNFFWKDYHQDCFSDIKLFSFTPQIKKGDLIIFPSNMIHEVKPQLNDDPRITIAFNTTSDQIELLEEKSYKFNFYYNT